MSEQTVVEKKKMREQYDLQGWEKIRGNLFRDAARFEDLRPVVDSYRTKCHLRVNQHLVKEGKYLIDVASGPVQYPEYLSYSEGYDVRICCDLSYTALIEAKKVIRPQDECVQCDITRLPFAKEAVQGIVSLHTIYHVPQEQQGNAIKEIFRVLGKDRHAVIVYSQSRYSVPLKVLGYPIKWMKPITRIYNGVKRRVKKLLGTFKKRPEIWSEKLYFYAHPYTWLQETLAPLGDFDILSWRSLPVTYTKFYIHPLLLGKAILALLYQLEAWFPRWFGRHGAYPMIVLRKK